MWTQYDIVENSLFEGVDPQLADPLMVGTGPPQLYENGEPVDYPKNPNLDPIPDGGLILNQWPQEGGDEVLTQLPDIPEGTDLPASGWPAAVAIRPGNWAVENRDYKLAWGDTLSGLAATYLGSPQRWKDIWNEQSDPFRLNNNPDALHAGTWIRMPVDAVTTLYCAYGRTPPGGAACPVAPPGGYKMTGGSPSLPSSGGNAMMYAGAAAALIAGYFIFKKPSA
jgi:hypothetical protein